MTGRSRDALSLVLGLAGLLMLGFGLNQLANTGSCSSGGPYISTRTCPSGTWALTFLLIAGTVAWIAGIAVSRDGLKQGTGLLLWTVGFVALGVGGIIKVSIQDSVPPDARLGVYIMSAVFIPVGLGLVAGNWLERRRSATDISVRANLGRLRSAGVLTRDEFTRLKGMLADPGTEQRVAVLQHLAEDNARGLLTESEFADRKRAALA
ncbi:hypothetical protein ACQP00_23635 [Dactylosporangium sp. CS-047395]|uniref:hypothetical protein n=1 Tax=Dactylosporangium sp. CS-047395 TaxID=3239936 RepID=UPI003D8B6732